MLLMLNRVLISITLLIMMCACGLIVANNPKHSKLLIFKRSLLNDDIEYNITTAFTDGSAIKKTIGGSGTTGSYPKKKIPVGDKTLATITINKIRKKNKDQPAKEIQTFSLDIAAINTLFASHIHVVVDINIDISIYAEGQGPTAKK